MPTSRLFLAVLAALAAPRASVASHGFSKPALGFNNCNLQCCNATMPSARFLLRTADAIVRRGLKDAGYLYVNMVGADFGGQDCPL